MRQWPNWVRHGMLHAGSSAVLESSQGNSRLVTQPLVWILRQSHARMCAQFTFSHVWLFVTPWTVACQAPLSIVLSQQEYWIGLPSLPSGDLPNPGIELASPVAPALAGGFFTWATWEAPWGNLSDIYPPKTQKKVSSTFLVSRVFLTEDAGLLMVQVITCKLLRTLCASVSNKHDLERWVMPLGRSSRKMK